MNIKIIITVFVGTFVVIGGLIWLAQPTASLNTGQISSTGSLLKSSEKSFDFGTISMINGNVNHEFQIVNSSEQSIVIKKIYTSCMCTTANFKTNGRTYGSFGMPGHGGGATRSNITLNPGSTGNLEVVYDPNAHGPAGVGPIDRFVYIEDKNGGQLELEIKAIVTP